MLFRQLIRTGIYRPGHDWLSLGLRVAAATVAMTAFLLWVLALAGEWSVLGSWPRSGWLALAVLGGGGVYFAAALLVGLRPSQFRLR
jgi:peptidoglycan biosynthesis protein MviN/MurJ (putative lipid II flippase)